MCYTRFGPAFKTAHRRKVPVSQSDGGIRHHFPMTATEAYRASLRDRIGPALREEGLRGSGSTWSLRSAHGDWAIVNAQSSSSSSKAEVRFIVNLSIVCFPWLRYRGLPIPKVPKESHGLWRDRLHPTSAAAGEGPEAWWSVSNEATARQAADDVVAQLHSAGVPLLRRLLHREALIDTIKAGDLGFSKGSNSSRPLFDSALVVLLADEGRTDEAAEVLARLGMKEDEASQVAFQKLTRWLAEWSSEGCPQEGHGSPWTGGDKRSSD